MKTIFRGGWRPRDLVGPAILVSNHRSYLDPFFLLEFMPFISNLWPIRFLASKRFFQNKFHPLGLLMRLGGCTPIDRVTQGQTTLEEQLKGAEQSLVNKEVMVIFPEGKITKQLVPTRGGRGAAYLAMKTDSPIIPFFIDGNNNLSFIRTIFMKERVKIFVGEPFKLSGNYNDEGELLRGTEKILAEIGSLPTL